MAAEQTGRPPLFSSLLALFFLFPSVLSSPFSLFASTVGATFSTSSKLGSLATRGARCVGSPNVGTVLGYRPQGHVNVSRCPSSLRRLFLFLVSRRIVGEARQVLIYDVGTVIPRGSHNGTLMA